MSNRRTSVRVNVIPGAMDRIARSPSVADGLQEIVDDLAADLRDVTPVRTGKGRRSIKGRIEPSSTGWVGTASWDEDHFYLGIVNVRGRRAGFADPIINRVRYV